MRAGGREGGSPGGGPAGQGELLPLHLLLLLLLLLGLLLLGRLPLTCQWFLGFLLRRLGWRQRGHPHRQLRGPVAPGRLLLLLLLPQPSCQRVADREGIGQGRGPGLGRGCGREGRYGKGAGPSSSQVAVGRALLGREGRGSESSLRQRAQRCLGPGAAAGTPRQACGCSGGKGSEQPQMYFLLSKRGRLAA